MGQGVEASFFAAAAAENPFPRQPLRRKKQNKKNFFLTQMPGHRRTYLRVHPRLCFCTFFSPSLTNPTLAFGDAVKVATSTVERCG
jgi:hypothetical protein